MDVRELQDEVFQTAVEHGWWPLKSENMQNSSDINVFAPDIDLTPVNIPEKLALMHSELSEALEHFRAGTMELFAGENGKPDGFWVELGDCVIRILDLAGAYGVDMEYMIRVKADYNKTRPYRHGDKKC